MLKVIFVVLSIPISLVLIFTLQIGFLFIVLGLLPSAVAYFVDGFKGKPTFKCVLSCNLAGMVPTFSDVFRSDSVAASMQVMMGDYYIWFLALGGAACGYGLLIFTRIVTQIGMSIADQTRIDILIRKQKELVEEWGENVKVRQY